MGNLNFQPTPEFPALQYLDSVDPGSQAERAGLRGGDFIMEVGTTGDMLCVHVKSIGRYLGQAERAGLRGGDFVTEVGTRGAMMCIRVKSISRNQGQAERVGLRGGDFIIIQYNNTLLILKKEIQLLKKKFSCLPLTNNNK